MYINSFVAGVLTTIFSELAVLFLWALISMGGKRR